MSIWPFRRKPADPAPPSPALPAAGAYDMPGRRSVQDKRARWLARTRNLRMFLLQRQGFHLAAHEPVKGFLAGLDPADAKLTTRAWIMVPLGLLVEAAARKTGRRVRVSDANPSRQAIAALLYDAQQPGEDAARRLFNYLGELADLEHGALVHGDADFVRLRQAQHHLIKVERDVRKGRIGGPLHHDRILRGRDRAGNPVYEAVAKPNAEQQAAIDAALARLHAAMGVV